MWDAGKMSNEILTTRATTAGFVLELPPDASRQQFLRPHPWMSITDLCGTHCSSRMPSQSGSSSGGGGNGAPLLDAAYTWPTASRSWSRCICSRTCGNKYKFKFDVVSRRILPPRL